jgi:vacuolar-type H+-ATPase subunit H
MTGNDHIGSFEHTDLPDEQLSRLRQVESECARMLEEAREKAVEIVRQAEREAEHLRSLGGLRDRELLTEISERIVAMGEAYREAMAGARMAVENMAELARRPSPASYPPAGGPGEPPGTAAPATNGRG